MIRISSLAVRFWVYLFFISLASLVLILLATSKYGAGVSSDAARNLSTADNLLAGRGFVDMVGSPFVLWPPLYPAILAGLSRLTMWSTFQSAWYLNIFLYALNIWLAGWLLYMVFRKRPVFAVIGVWVILLSRSVLRIHANVASEPLFETLVLLHFFAAARYLISGSRRALWFICILAGLASLHRYLGVVLIGVTILLVLRKDGIRGIWWGAIPLLASILPIAGWVLGHNLPASGTLFGPRDLGEMMPLLNVNLALTKILWWFVPRYSFLDWLVLRPWLILAGLALLLIAFNRRADWINWIRVLSGVYMWPALLFSVAYFFLLAFTVVTTDHLDLTSDRYYIILLPVLVCWLLITLDTLILSHLNLRTGLHRFVLAGLTGLWFIYPAYGLQAYLRQALVQGEPTNYNIANSANFRDMSVVKAAIPILENDPEALVYSNYLNIVWFLYGHPVEALPYQNADLPRNQRLLELRRNYPSWPERNGYIIWFTPNQYHHIVSPEELAEITNLQLLFQDETGQIFAVEAH